VRAERACRTSVTRLPRSGPSTVCITMQVASHWLFFLTYDVIARPWPLGSSVSRVEKVTVTRGSAGPSAGEHLVVVALPVVAHLWVGSLDLITALVGAENALHVLDIRHHSSASASV
jgi:hypothetical protein